FVTTWPPSSTKKPEPDDAKSSPSPDRATTEGATRSTRSASSPDSFWSMLSFLWVVGVSDIDRLLTVGRLGFVPPSHLPAELAVQLGVVLVGGPGDRLARVGDLLLVGRLRDHLGAGDDPLVVQPEQPGEEQVAVDGVQRLEQLGGLLDLLEDDRVHLEDVGVTLDQPDGVVGAPRSDGDASIVVDD